MAEALTVKSVYKMLRQYTRNRPDVGVVRAMLDGMLEPASPFDRKEVRSPSRWFLLLSFLATLIFACFVYFNRVW